MTKVEPRYKEENEISIAIDNADDGDIRVERIDRDDEYNERKRSVIRREENEVHRDSHRGERIRQLHGQNYTYYNNVSKPPKQIYDKRGKNCSKNNECEIDINFKIIKVCIFYFTEI